jgi:DNA invertase Pin-like site-specific DNA recombinase
LERRKDWQIVFTFKNMEYKKEKNELVRKLRKEGNSYAQIGKMVGITRQRVHQILTRYISPSRKLALKDLKNKIKKND